jgi:AcrR family transcriptional regulator
MTRAPSPRFERRKHEIVNSAVHGLNLKGVRGMTLADVAERLGLVPTGVIYYFKNKEELAEACFLLAIARFRQLLDVGAAQVATRDRIAAFNAAAFDFRRQVALGEVEPIAVFNDVRALNRPAVNEAYVEMFRHARALFEGPETAELTRVERNARAHLLLSEAFWNVVWLPKLAAEDYGRAADRASSLLTDGLVKPGAVWRPLTLKPLNPEGQGDASSEMFLRAATQLINEEGYLGASVEKISARLNVTKGAFYHHHETKDELVAACFARTFEIMRRALRQAEAASETGLQTLASAAAALVDYQMSGGAPLLRTSALTSVPETIQPQLVAQFDRISDRFAALISDGIADGSIRPVDVNIAAQMITAMINASAELQFWTPGMAAESAGALYVRPFFEGLLTPGVG